MKSGRKVPQNPKNDTFGRHSTLIVYIYIIRILIPACACPILFRFLEIQKDSTSEISWQLEDLAG